VIEVRGDVQRLHLRRFLITERPRRRRAYAPSSPAVKSPMRMGKAIQSPQLSCELCRKRKVKCDKLNPCTNCTTSRTPCVPIYRTRLPRGRHVTRARRISTPPPTADPGGLVPTAQPTFPANGNFQERINRLEALIESMRSGPTPAGSREQVLQLLQFHVK
jgi:hypothetical protein